MKSPRTEGGAHDQLSSLSPSAAPLHLIRNGFDIRFTLALIFEHDRASTSICAFRRGDVGLYAVPAPLLFHSRRTLTDIKIRLRPIHARPPIQYIPTVTM